MIRIRTADVPPPAQLVDVDQPHMTELEQAADNGSLQSKDFNKSLYDAAKPRRWREQHHKCCFCEQPYEQKFFTVEHFRPKTRAVDTDGTAHVGYWWLAYDFENLFFCCPICNNFKSDSFPLAPGARRLSKFEHPSRVQEDALVVHPSTDDPREHIGWTNVGGGYQPVALSDKGRHTIDLCRLDRDDLLERRTNHVERRILPLLGLCKAAEAATEDLRTNIVAYARGLTSSQEPFAALAHAIFSEHGIL